MRTAPTTKIDFKMLKLFLSGILLAPSTLKQRERRRERGERREVEEEEGEVGEEIVRR